MARLYALSKGEDHVTKETWDYVKELERQRQERVDALPKPSGITSSNSASASAAVPPK